MVKKWGVMIEEVPRMAGDMRARVGGSQCECKDAKVVSGKGVLNGS